MTTTKTLAEAQDKAPAGPIVAKQPETPEKLGGPQLAAAQTATASAATPPNGAPSSLRRAALLTSGSNGPGAAPRAQLMRTLQRSVGNTRVANLIGRQIQTKLSVGEVDDPQEREADRVAETVTQPGSKSEDSVPRQIVMKYSLARLAQRKTKQEETKKPDEEPAAQDSSPAEVEVVSRTSHVSPIHREVSSDAKHEEVDGKMEHRITSPSGGQPLPEGVRREMEAGLGADFSNVRVHDSATDQADAGSLNAKAFTHGSDIWLGAGASANDPKLMAHELTHVVQQGSNLSRTPIQRSLADLDDELDDVFVDEARVIALIAGLTSAEKRTVLTGTRYRDLIADSLNVSEMVRAVNNLGPDLAVKLEWVEAASGLFGISYSNISSMVTSALPPERNALKTPRWKEFFGEVCNNTTIIEAVTDLKFDLVTQLEWIEAEASTTFMSYSEIKPLIVAATQPDRDLLKTPHWREFFVDVCNDATMAEALRDLKFDLRTRLDWMGAEGTSAQAQTIEFTSHHPMAAFGGDPKVNPTWAPGSSDHAVAYSKGGIPRINAIFSLDANLGSALIMPLSVQVKEGGAARGTRAGITASLGTMSVPSLDLTALTGSTDVRESSYTFEWLISEDGVTWESLGTTAVHLVYWLFAAPATAPLYNFAAAKVTRYAAGMSAAGAVADAIRHGPRGMDGLAYDPADSINSDPLSVFADGKGICTDYANLLTLLALSAGLPANAIMFWGGFQSMGKNIWVVLGGPYGLINMVEVTSPVPGYNVPQPPISLTGWAFNYHAISNINGVLQDSALDRQGIDAQAAHQGKAVRLVESTAALPAATAGTPYSERIVRTDHTVDVTIRHYGTQISLVDFGDVFPVVLPPAAPLPYEVPVNWALQTGAMPPGLTLNALTGQISGNPTVPGAYTFSVRVATPGPRVLSNIIPLTIDVNP